MVIGQLLTVVMALGLLIGNDYPLVQMVAATTAVCFGFGSLGQVGGLMLAGPLYHLGGAQYSFGFGAVITCILLAIAYYLRGQPVSV